jgi:hypothetical protein
MSGLRPSELNSAMRKCLATASGAGARGVLAAVAREMCRVRGLPDDAAGPFISRKSNAAVDAVRGLCRDLPGFENLLRADDCLGQVYQAINEPALAAAYRATARSGGKFDDSEIPAVTQLFTPAWVVRFLLHNTLGRSWLQLHPVSRLELEWLVDTDGREKAGSAAQRAPALARELTVLDPACGTMNFGMAAFDLLAGMYREEMDRAGQDGWPAEPSVRHEDQVPGAVLRHNLFGIDIDPIVLELARESIAMKLRRPVSIGESNLLRADALLDEPPGNWPAAFEAIVTNPPYLSARNLAPGRVRRLKAAYPTAWRDGCACFVDRGLHKLRPGGRAGFLVAQSILFTGSYESWRKQVVGQSALEALAHFGPGLFGVGNAGTLQTAGLVLRREDDASVRDRQTVVAFRLVEPSDAAGKRQILERAISEARAPSGQARPEKPGGSGVPSRARPLSPSPGTPGQGRGEGVFLCENRRRPSPQPSPGVPGEGEEGSTSDKGRLGYHLLQKDLATLPRGAWAYWALPADRDAFAALPRLGTIAAPRQGLATTDNARFVRYWWEVEPLGACGELAEPTCGELAEPACGELAEPVNSAGIEMRATPGRWAPYAKGGRFRRWYEAARHRVNWEDDGRDIKAAIVARYPYLNGKWQWVAKNASWYGRGGITYSYLTSGRFSARRLEPGCVFDVAGSALFPAGERQTLGLLAMLNSSSAARLLNVINPTLNFQVGDLSELPVPSALPDSLAELARSAICLQQGLDRFDETSPDFVAPLAWADAEEIWRTTARELGRLEREIDEQVAGLYGLPVCPVEPVAGPPFDRAELARQWVSYAIGVEMGRWGDPAGTVDTGMRLPSDAMDERTRLPMMGISDRTLAPHSMVRLRPADPRWIDRLRDRLAAWVGSAGLSEITAAAGRLDEFVARGFFPWHVRRFRRRPVYWVLGGPTTAHLVRHDLASADMVRHALAQCNAALPAGWARHIDDGIVNLAPLAGWVPEPALRRELTHIAADLAAGSYGWSKTAQTMYAARAGRARHCTSRDARR